MTKLEDFNPNTENLQNHWFKKTECLIHQLRLNVKLYTKMRSGFTSHNI